MEISASMVMQLREKTGVSMMACKKALTEANGDMDKAVEILRKSGEAKAASKADRATHEGRLFIQVKGSKLLAVGLSCETDFVARNEDFAAIGEKMIGILENGDETSAREQGEALLKEAVVKLGENMSVSLVKKLEGKNWGYYIHSNNKLAAAVSVENGTEDQAKEVAMHVAATNPGYLSPADVAESFVNQEVEIMKANLKNEGKPENIWDKILEGKVKKLREEHALLTQNFVKDPSMTVEKFLNGAKITHFERFAL